MGAILEIPQFVGKIEIPSTQTEMHIGKQEIKNAVTVIPKDGKAFDQISSVRKDAQGQIFKEQFIIYYKNGQYLIEDRGSTNGTYLGGQNLKGLKPQILNDGAVIILGIEDNGKMVQLQINFKVVPDNLLSSGAVYSEPSSAGPAYHAPSYSGASSAGPQNQQPVYNTPTPKAQGNATNPSGVSSVPIPGGNSVGSQAVYNDPQASNSGLAVS